METQTPNTNWPENASERGPLIGEVRKNSRETIRVQLTEYEGHKLCDLRVWANATVPGAPPTPTKKGVTFSRSILPDVIELLQQAEAMTDGDRDG
ncbi:MAG: hypothetical protein FJ388_21375 [Verrucomicrobia bacterium]|nr:hypothetical protein [Verrucomicrobiota bacterium]